MKKLFVLLFSVFILNTSSMALELIPFSVNYDDEQPGTNGQPKSPMMAPKVYIDDYTLYFAQNHPDFVLNIKDEYDNVVFTTIVYSIQTQVILPSTLSGDYQIELVMGNWLFKGWTDL